MTRLAASLLLVLALCSPLAAQGTATPEPTVDDVRVEREGRVVVDPAITGLLDTVAGRPLSMRQVRETIAHLINLNQFDDVQVLSEPSGRGGVRLIYRLVPAHPIERVEFRGVLGLSEGDLRRAINERYGEVPSAGQVQNVIATLRSLYRDRGYPSTMITSEIVQQHDPDRATLVLTVQAGPRPPIVDVQLTQLDAEENGLLDDRPVLRTGVPYDKAVVDRELQRWTDRMRARGYYEARASHGVLFPPDGAALSVSVTRGPLITVDFTGDPLSSSDRERLVPIRAEASADEDLLEDSARRIEAFLKGRGYRNARVTYTRTPRPREVVITFDVRRGAHFEIGTVEVTGAMAMTPMEVRELLAIREGQPFTDAAIGAGVNAIRSAYLTRGFVQVKVDASQMPVTPPAPGSETSRVNVQVRIAEGPRTTVRGVTFEGAGAIGEATLRGLVQLAPGRPFSERQMLDDRDRIDLEYRNHGYDEVAVRSEVMRVSDTQADVRFSITPGPQIFVDRVIIVGNTRTKAETIRRELLVKPGQPLSYSDLVESRLRLGALGLFRRATIEELPHPSESRRDIFVRVEEAQATVVGGGGGVEGTVRVRSENGQAVERFEFAPRGFFQIGRRNLWGKNRSVDLFGRVSLRSRDVAVSSNGVDVNQTEGKYGFNEYRVVGSFKEPRAFGTRSDVLFTTILEQGIRSSFNFLRREARVETGVRLSRVYSLTGRYSIQRTEIFDENITDPSQQPLIDRIFPQVRLSTFAGSFIRDSRDDVLDSSRGSLVSVDSDLAARRIGSEVGYVKAYVQGRTYFTMPSQRRTVLAFAARLGAAHGFPRTVPLVDANGAPVLGADGQPVVDIVQDLPASERFFAGGDTTVRGFALDRLGDTSTISATGFPIGGNGVVVLNAEARVALTGRLQGVGFVDAGNVVARASDIDLFKLRSAAGFGIRFRSPVGPIRLDLGFKLDRRELSPGRLERRSVWHISLGQAF